MIQRPARGVVERVDRLIFALMLILAHDPFCREDHRHGPVAGPQA